MKWISNIKQIGAQLILSLKKYKPEDSILLYSMPRGGSTWLMEQIAQNPEVIINWEPAHKFKGLFYEVRPYDYTFYIPEEEKNPTMLSLFKKVISFKKSNTWTLTYVHFQNLIQSQKVLTKFVRANNTLPWLSQNIEFKHKPIVLVRHPIAVAQSILKAFDIVRDKDYNNMPEPIDIENDLYQKYWPILEQAKTGLTFLVAQWCLENVLLLQNPDNKWHIVLYENLLRYPEEEIRKINEACQLDIKYDEGKLREASTSSKNTGFLKDVNQQLSKWQTEISEEEKQSVQKILDAFEIDLYSADNPLPTL